MWQSIRREGILGRRSSEGWNCAGNPMRGIILRTLEEVPVTAEVYISKARRIRNSLKLLEFNI